MCGTYVHMSKTVFGSESYVILFSFGGHLMQPKQAVTASAFLGDILAFTVVALVDFPQVQFGCKVLSCILEELKK